MNAVLEVIYNQLVDSLGLVPEFAHKMALIDFIAQQLGYPIGWLSGRRSHEEQRLLRDQGRPAAQRSWHTEGRAGDVIVDDRMKPMFDDMARWLGIRVGSDFTTPDPNHYDLPGPTQPQPSW